MILVAVALVLTLANTALVVMNPTAKKVEQFNEELKTDQAESVTTLHKKIDAIYKVVNTKDGYLTLTEIEKTECATAHSAARLEHGGGLPERGFLPAAKIVLCPQLFVLLLSSSQKLDFFMAQLPIHHENCAENSSLKRHGITV